MAAAAKNTACNDQITTAMVTHHRMCYSAWQAGEAIRGISVEIS
jgi:hypothetical protein